MTDIDAHYSHMTDTDAPGRGQFEHRAQLAGLMKGTAKHCYILNIEVMGLVVSEKKIIYVSPIVSLWALSIAMETTILKQSSQNHIAINPSTL